MIDRPINEVELQKKVREEIALYMNLHCPDGRTHSENIRLQRALLYDKIRREMIWTAYYIRPIKEYEAEERRLRLKELEWYKRKTPPKKIIKRRRDRRYKGLKRRKKSTLLKNLDWDRFK